MDPVALIFPAPAKINLFLHVVGRRPDGYHLLQTAFQFLDFGDELAFEVDRGGALTLSRPLPGVDAESDLCLRAARRLRQATGTPLGARITTTKRIPMGGGLGGGSSDAATVLLALNHLWRTGLSLNELAALGLELGADVPVFVHGHAAWAEGVGEDLTPIQPLETSVVVLTPAVACGTARVFAEFARDSQLTAYRPPITIRDFHAGRAGNDLEPVVRRLYPEVDRALSWLGRFGTARMTGSGSSVFLPVEDRERGESILAAARAAAPAYVGVLARTLNVHPIHVRHGADTWGVAKR